MNTLRWFGAVAAAAGLALAATAMAADGGDVDPSVLAAIHAVKPAAYPSANTVTVRYDESIAFQADGTYTDHHHEVTLVLTPEGRNDAASHPIVYVTGHDHVTDLVARVIKADGTVVPVPSSGIQDTVQGGAPGMNIYDPDARQISVAFSGLAPGDATEITYTDVVEKPYRPNYFDDQIYFMDFSPVLAQHYEISGPTSMPLTIRNYHTDRGAPAKFVKTTDGDRTVYTWTVENEPQLIPEPMMDYVVEEPAVRVSTDPSWASMSRWIYAIDLPKMAVTPAIQAQVAKLVADAKTRDEKVKALYDFVSTDVRYRGGSYVMTGFDPRPAEDTLKSRWGVCRDVATLLVTMLRAADIPAYPVVTNAGQPVYSDIAQIGMNHEIVAIEHADRQGAARWQYLDPTAKNSKEYLPAEEAEQQVLVATPKGEDLGLTPALPPSANLGHAIATTTVDANGTMTSKVQLKTTGLFDLDFRSIVARRSPVEQRQLVESVMHARFPSAELLSYSTSDPLALGTPMEIDFAVKVPHAATAVGDARLLRSLVTSGALGLVEAYLPSVFGSLPSRQYGLDAHLTFQYDEDETITLPAGTKVLALPNDASATNAVSSFESKCAATDATTLTCHRSFQMKSRFIDPKQYTALRATFATLGQIAHQPLILGGTAIFGSN